MKRVTLIAALLACSVVPLAPVVARAEDHAEQQSTTEAPRKVLNRVVPAYPALARTMNVRGVVKIEAVVAPNGTVKSVEVKGGHPLLIQSAETAVRKWKWQTGQHESREIIEMKFDADK